MTKVSVVFTDGATFTALTQIPGVESVEFVHMGRGWVAYSAFNVEITFSDGSVNKQGIADDGLYRHGWGLMFDAASRGEYPEILYKAIEALEDAEYEEELARIRKYAEGIDVMVPRLKALEMVYEFADAEIVSWQAVRKVAMEVL